MGSMDFGGGPELFPGSAEAFRPLEEFFTLCTTGSHIHAPGIQPLTV